MAPMYYDKKSFDHLVLGPVLFYRKLFLGIIAKVRSLIGKEE